MRGDVNDALQRPITVLLVLRSKFDQNRNIIPKMARIDFPRTKQRQLLIVSIFGKFCLVHQSKTLKSSSGNFNAQANSDLTLVGDYLLVG